jgi:S-formylglutathione hydrolase FrmB
VTVLGVAAFIALLADRRRRFWTRSLPIVALACLAVVAGTDVLVEDVWSPFPDALPVSNLFWAWLGLVALGLAGVHVWRSRWWVRVVAPSAALLVIAMAVVQVNIFWGLYPTVHSAWDGMWSQPEGLPVLTTPDGPVLEAPPGQTLLDVWQPPPGMPDKGTVSQVTIPGSESHFPARPGFVYLPPAYLANPRPLLPVVVLLSGQPGAPENWIDWIQAPAALDAYARAHNGLAPVVVMPDDLGSSFANPLCVDSPRGNAETYLARDVPAWIQSTLQVARQRSSWFIGGFSHGGTCSLQLALRASKIYGGFVDIAGEKEPTLGNRQKTVSKAFGGSDAAFARINPLDIMQRSRFPETAVLMMEGNQDLGYADARHVFEACRAAGMDGQWVDLAGGHTPEVWRAAVVRALPWVAGHSRLAPVTTAPG